MNWTPTAENINRLPEPIRKYIHEIETICDPAGIIAENTLLRDEIMMIAKYKEGLAMKNIFGEPEKPVEVFRFKTTLKDLKSGLDIEKAKTHFAGYKRQIESLKKEVQEFEIKTDDDSKELTRISLDAQNLWQKIDDERKEKIKIPDKFVRSLNAFVKDFKDILSEPKKKTGLVQIAKQKIGQYQYQKELERRKKEEAARKAQERLQEEMNKEAQAAGVEAPELPPVVLPEKQEAIRTGSGSAHMQTEWVYELARIDFVPIEYLMVNDKAVKAAIKAGIRDIDGLIIKEVPKVSLRKV